jgi:hypothetical protein
LKTVIEDQERAIKERDEQIAQLKAMNKKRSRVEFESNATTTAHDH